MQTPVDLVATDNQDRSITLAFPGGKRVEYVVGDRYESLSKAAIKWAQDGWYNHIVSQLTQAAREIYVEGLHSDRRHLPDWASPQRKKTKEIDTVTDSKDKPSLEYPYTVIAPTAKGLSYNGQRKWFKDQESATVFCGEVFEAEGKGSFELAIVKCVDVVRPKPTIQLMSSWEQPAAAIESKTS